VVASDPGLNRLRTAVSAAVAMSSTLALEYALGQALHAGRQGTTVGMLLGTVLAMLGSMALTGTGVRTKAATAAGLPVALGTGMLVGVAVGGHPDLKLCGFVAVLFAAVFVRRFGAAFFFYGFLLWMGYFFAAFLNATLSTLPWLLLTAVLASAWLLVLSVTVLRTNARRTLRRVQRAFGARARAVARACADLLEAGEADAERRSRLRRRLHARQLRLAEAALMIEGWSAERGALPEGWSAPALRRRLLDAQLTVDALAGAADALAGGSPESAREGARIARYVARHDYRGAELAARPLLDAPPPRPGTDAGADGAEDDGRWPLHHLASAAAEFAALADRSAEPPPTRAEGSPDFEPAVVLALGNLPGSAAVAGEVPARGSWNPLSRMTLTTRQSVQVAIAGALAIALGRQISEARYYWAVIAAFIAFTGTATRSETFIKAANRVLGTLAGLGAGIGLAHVTAGRTTWVLVVIVVSMSCGFYLMRISYAFMIFFVTIMVSQLYTVLHEFSAELLVLRLEETAAGAVAGIAVALVVVPTSTRDTARSAQQTFFLALADLLRATAARLAGGRGEARTEEDTGGAGEGAEARAGDGAGAGARAGGGAAARAAGGDLDALARVMDHRLSQLALVSRPLTRSLVWGNDPRLVRHRLTLCAAAARQCRALALNTGRLPSPAPANGLAPVCRTLADSVTALAGSPPRRSAVVAEAERRLRDAEAALLAQRPQCAGRPLPPVTRPLAHLSRLLQELADTPPVAPARRRHAAAGRPHAPAAPGTSANVSAAGSAAGPADSPGD